MAAEITVLSSSVQREVTSPPPERLLEGDPEHAVCNSFSDPSAQFFAGRWSSTPGKWIVRYTEFEFCHITAGRVRIASRTGKPLTFGPGDSFVVPAGFEGTWEVLEDCEKLYAIFQPAIASAAPAT